MRCFPICAEGGKRRNIRFDFDGRTGNYALAQAEHVFKQRPSKLDGASVRICGKDLCNLRFVLNPCPIRDRKKRVAFVVANIRMSSQPLLFKIFGKECLKCRVSWFIAWNSYSTCFPDNVRTGVGIVHKETANLDGFFL